MEDLNIPIVIAHSDGSSNHPSIETLEQLVDSKHSALLKEFGGVEGLAVALGSDTVHGLPRNEVDTIHLREARY